MDMQRILIVDDEPSIRSLYQLEFEDSGFDVRTAADSESALRLVRDWSPHLVVLDVRLGDECGLDLLRRMVELRPELRSVIVTAYAGYKDDFASWLADAFLPKSQDLGELRHTVSELLGVPQCEPVG
jgi:DNA-binding NtrC family response regulator